MLRNLFGTDVVNSIVIPVAGAAAGFVAARYLGNLIAMKDWGTTNTKIAKTVAAGLAIPATFAIARKVPLVAKNSGAIVLGMGLAAAEAWIRDTPLLGGSGAAAALTTDIAATPPPATTAASGLASYYDYPVNQDGQALGDDYYTAQMLGNTGDPADQSNVEGALDNMEGVSTVIPTDMAMQARNMPQWQRVREGFANQGDRGYAGGMFSRHLFAGMMGS